MSDTKPVEQHHLRPAANQRDVPSPTDEVPEGYTPPMTHGGLYVDPNHTPRLADRLGSVRTDALVHEHWPRDIAPVFYPDLPNSFWLDVPGEAPEPPSSPPDIIDPPAVTSCDPNFGGVGTVVTLTGTNFFDPVTVQWTDGTNTYASTSVTIINTTEVTADANVGSKKNSRWTVIVTTLVGQASLDNAFQCDGTLLTGYIPIEPFPDPSDALQAQEAPDPAPEALGGSGGTTDPSPATTEGPTEINIQADQVTVQADEVTVQGPEVSSEGTTEPSEEAEQVEMTEYEMDQMWGITEPGAEPEP